MPYTPSRAELEKFNRLLAKLTPSAAAYREYRNLVAHFLDLAPSAIAHGDVDGLTSVRLRKSALFSGHEYLIAYVTTDWLRQIAGTCDAIVSPMVDPQQQGCLPRPPLVFVPETNRRSRNETFRSVLEHEFVHVNQALLGTFPERPVGRRAEDSVEDFLATTRAEYEASVLQLTRWPQLYPQDIALSLDHWCVLRGYTQALEAFLVGAAKRDLPPDEVVRFLELLPEAIPMGFQRLGVSAKLVVWFTERLGHHLKVANLKLIDLYPDIMATEAFKAAALWADET